MDFTFLENFDLWQIPKILTNLSCYFIQFALILFAAWLAFSGIRFFLSRGNPTALNQAKKVFLFSLVGGLVVFGVYTLIFTLAGIFGFSGLSITSTGCGIQGPVTGESEAYAVLASATENIIDLNNQLNAASGPSATALAVDLENAIQQRNNLITSLIQSYPAQVYGNLLTPAQISQFPSNLQASLEQPVLLSSVPIDVYHADDFQSGQAWYEYYADIGGQSQQVYIVGGDPDILSGSSVDISGYNITGSGIIASDQNLQIVGAAAVSGSTGNQRVLVVLINTNDNPGQPFTQNDARQYVFGTMADFYRENSYNQVSFSGDVFGWFRLNKNTGSQHCADSVEKGDIRDVLNQNGINYFSSDRVVAFVNGCSGGYGTIGKGFNGLGLSVVGLTANGQYVGDDLYNIYSYKDFVLGHEMGHTLGVYHANSWDCSSGGPLIGQCQHNEYGNSFDVMGAGGISLHMNAGHKRTLNWLSPLVINQSGRYSLTPIETGPNGAYISGRVVRFQIPVNLFLEYRRAAGFDANLANWPDNQNGLLINWATGSSKGTRLLDMDPASPVSWVLPVGGRFADTQYDIDIRVISADASQIVFDVSFLSNPLPPPLSYAQSSYGGYPGYAQSSYVSLPGNFNIINQTGSITNNDIINCPNPSTAAVTIQWTSSAGATLYRIFHKVWSFGTYVDVGTTTGTSFSHIGAPNASNHYYVQAENSAGSTIASPGPPDGAEANCQVYSQSGYYSQSAYGGPPSPSSQVQLCSDINYGGICEIFISSDPWLDDRDNIFKGAYIVNDSASSVRVPAGTTVWLCQDVAFGAPNSPYTISGFCEAISGDDPDLSNNPVGDNTVSSIRFAAPEANPSCGAIIQIADPDAGYCSSCPPGGCISFGPTFDCSPCYYNPNY